MSSNVQPSPAFSKIGYFVIFLANHDAKNHRIIIFPYNFSKIILLQANLSFILESFHAKTSKNMKKMEPKIFNQILHKLHCSNLVHAWFSM